MTAPRRLALLGGAGSGKSTLARRLSEALRAPVVHLDRLAYGPGWRRIDTATLRERLSPLVAQETWVVEGVYPEVADLVLARADLTIWLDQPLWRRLWRAWRKTRIHRGRPRADRPEGCDEAFGWGYAWQVMQFGGWSENLRARLEPAAAGPVICLRGDRAIEGFVAGLTREPPA